MKRVFWILSVSVAMIVTSLSLVACGGASQRTQIQRGDGGGSSGGNGTGALGKLTAAECGESKKEILNLTELIERMESLDADPAKTYFREMFAFPSAVVDQIPDIQSDETTDPHFATSFLNENRVLGLNVARMNQLLEANSLFRVQQVGTDCTKLLVRFLPSFIGFDSIQQAETRPQGDDLDRLDRMEALLEQLAGEGAPEEVIDEEGTDDAAVTVTGVSEKVVEFDINVQLSTRDRLVMQAVGQDFWLVYSVNKRKDEEEVTVRVILPSEVASCNTGESALPYVLEYVQVLSWNNSVVRISKSYLAKVESHLTDTRDLDDLDEDGETVDIGLDTAVILNGKLAEDQKPTCESITVVEDEPVDKGDALDGGAVQPLVVDETNAE